MISYNFVSRIATVEQFIPPALPAKIQSISSQIYTQPQSAKAVDAPECNEYRNLRKSALVFVKKTYADIETEPNDVISLGPGQRFAISKIEKEYSALKSVDTRLHTFIRRVVQGLTKAKAR